MTERHLEGRHAIVTGGGRGIGLAIASALAERGASLTLMGRSMEHLREAVTRLAVHRTEVLVTECDVADGASVTSAFALSRRQFPAPHILVNNAGQGDVAPFAELAREVWDRMLAVNLTGTWLCTREVWPSMVASRMGRIVNVASVAGLRGFPGGSAYSAAKHGVVGLTRSLALEAARTGITVNAVCPGYTDTDMAARAAANVAAQRNVPLAEAEKIIARTLPLGRLITAEEVAATVAWLCSDGASAVNGQAIVIAGGDA